MPLVLACAPDAGSGEEEFSDETLVSLTIDAWRSYAIEGRVDLALDLVDDDFLLQGIGKDAMRNWISELQSYEGIALEIYQLDVAVDGDTAVVDYILTVSSCPQAEGDVEDSKDSDTSPEEPAPCTKIMECHSKDLGECGWLRYLSKGESGWTFSGDRSEFGYQFRLASGDDGVSLVGSIYDPGRRVLSGSVTWRGAGVKVELDKSASSVWTVPEGSYVPDGLYSSQPMPWYLDCDISTSKGAVRGVVEFVSIMEHFGTSLLPSGETPLPIEFSWSGLDKAIGGAEVHLYADEKILWRSDRVFEQPLSYAGPTLEAGRSYTYQVVQYDHYGNYSVAWTELIPIDMSEIAPKPTSIAPNTGPETGGTEVVITGKDFISMARVVFGTSECLVTEVVNSSRIECTTPALTPGIYNVIVQNPSGTTGMLERVFTVYAVP